MKKITVTLLTYTAALQTSFALAGVVNPDFTAEKAKNAVK